MLLDFHGVAHKWKH